MFSVLTSTEGLPYVEWLEFRQLGIGGSDASVVYGINKYKSPIELFMEKTGQMPHLEAGEAAYWGTQLESLVRAEFTKRTGIEVKEMLHEVSQAGIDLLENRTVFVGGGSILLKGYIERADMVAKPLFVHNVHANAEGYHLLYNNRKTAQAQGV